MSDPYGPLVEYRRYQVMPGKMAALQDRFARHAMPAWERHGIQPVGFWQPVVGDTGYLHYLVRWRDLAERERRWDAFQRDPDWREAKSRSEEAGPLVVQARNELWRSVRLSDRSP